MLLTSTSPIGIQTDAADVGAWFVFTFVLLHVLICLVCLLKGKLVMGLAGLPAPLFSYIGALRLAKPESFWARRFYGEKRLARTHRRNAKYEGRRLALRDKLFGG